MSTRFIDSCYLHNGGRYFNETSVTEDYELGNLAKRFGMPSIFSCTYYRKESGKREYIATREYFPKHLLRSIKQKGTVDCRYCVSKLVKYWLGRQSRQSLFLSERP